MLCTIDVVCPLLYAYCYGLQKSSHAPGVSVPLILDSQVTLTIVYGTFCIASSVSINENAVAPDR